MPIESDCQLITALQRADAIRRACQHNVTGLEGKKLAHISDQRNDFMDHVRSRTLLALFAVYAQAQRVFCGSPVNSAAGINPESGQELSNALAFSHGCPAFFIFP